MARVFTRGQNPIHVAAAPVTGYPFTYACWLSVTSVSPGGNQNALNSGHIVGANSNDWIGIFIDNATGKIGGFVSNSSNTFATIVNTASAALTANTFYPAVYVGVSSTSRTIYTYQSGSLVSTNDTVSSVFGGTTSDTWIGMFGNTPANIADFGGSCAECAAWNVVLSTAEITSYCRGARAYTIREPSLKGYWPLDGIVLPEPDLSGAVNNLSALGANSNPTLGFGPPLMQFTPRWPQFNFPPPPPPAFVLMPQIVM